MFDLDWKAYTCWLEEATIRERKHREAGTVSLKSMSQCLTLDPDLDSAPQRRAYTMTLQLDAPPELPCPDLGGLG